MAKNTKYSRKLTITGVLNEARYDQNLSVKERRALRDIEARDANLILRDEGYLTGRPKKWRVSDKGKRAGIEEQDGMTAEGEEYIKILYSPSAQLMVVDLLLKKSGCKRTESNPFVFTVEEASKKENDKYFDARQATGASKTDARRARLFIHERELLSGENKKSTFLERWGKGLASSMDVINQIFDDNCTQFFGSIVAEDDQLASEFIYDLAECIAIDAKIDYAKPINVIIDLMPCFDVEDSQFAFGEYTGVELPPKRLFVINKKFLDKASANDGEEEKAQYDAVVKALTSESPNRFAFFVGSEEELNQLWEIDEHFAQSFGKNVIHPTMQQWIDGLVDVFLSSLDKEVRDCIADEDEFIAKLKRHIVFNMDKQAYRGLAYAKKLAVYANAAKKPKLEVPKNGYDEDDMQQKLDAVVGLSAVKKALLEFRNEVYVDKLTNHNSSPNANHMVFVGNPGTGKTMMARLFAEFLPKMGVIQVKGRRPTMPLDPVEITSTDIFSEYVSKSEQNAAEKIKKALGTVLFVDEAYSFMGHVGDKSNSTGQVMATFVRAMEEHKGEFVVIFAGYEKEMARFLESNPGLKSRVPHTFRFDDYTTGELIELFDNLARKENYTYDSEQVHSKLRPLFKRNRKFRDFGNGRFARNVLAMAQRNLKSAVARGEVAISDSKIIRPEDIPSQDQLMGVSTWSFSNADEMLERLIGMEKIKEIVRRLEKEVEFQKKAQDAGLKLPEKHMHMLFTGNPGTGKTTVARIIGRVLYNVGVLPSNKFIEVEGRQLAKTSFGGESEVAAYIRDAIGGVLFIDEAYSILVQRNSDDIIATLVKAMEDYKGEFVLMLAGYNDEMCALTQYNPGLESRIGYTLRFDDYNADELLEIFKSKVSASGFTLTEGAEKKSRDVLRFFQNVERFGNGRFADKLLNEAISSRAMRFAISPTEEKDKIGTLVEEDIPGVEDMSKIVAVPVEMLFDEPTTEELRRVATHEAGHALCNLALGRKLSFLTIEREGNGSLGYVENAPSRNPLTKEEYEGEIIAALGGLAAEECVYGSYGPGGLGDLGWATKCAYAYSALLGMSKAGLLQYTGVEMHELPREVREAMRALLDDLFERAKQLIEEHRSVLDAIVEELLKEGTIKSETVERIWADHNKDGR